MARNAMVLCALALLINNAAAASVGWDAYDSGYRSMKVAGSAQSVGEQLGPVMSWTYNGTMDTIRRGQSYVGPNRRLRRVVADWLAGKPVEVAILGGSISTGAVASRKMAAVDPNDCWSMVRIYLQNTDPKLQFYNNARSACKSYIYSQCLPKFLNTTADLVFLEFVANDGSEMDVTLTSTEKTRSFERLVRKVLAQPSAPAVVMMQMLINGQAYPPGGQGNQDKLPYQFTPEDNYHNLAQYYGVPALSFRDAVYHLAEFEKDGFSWDSFMGPDRLHPNDLGHKIMADLVVYLLQQTAIDLLVHPLSAADLATTSTPLPPPMFNGNEIGDLQYAKCIQGQNLSEIAVQTDGWDMLAGANDQYPTYGYETTQQGKPLTLEINTQTPDGRVAGVNLYYTEADSGYGVYQISCSNGCQCDDQYIDAQLTYSQVVTFTTTVHPSAAPKCHVSVQLASNSTAGNKLRVNGVTVTGDPGEFYDARIGEEKYMSWLFGDTWAS